MKKLLYIFLILLTVSIFGGDQWSFEAELFNNKLFENGGENIKIIGTEERSFSTLENSLITKMRKHPDSDEYTRKASHGKLYDVVKIRADYELLSIVPKMGYFRWETEWEDTDLLVKKAGSYTTEQLIMKAYNYIVDKNLVNLTAVEKLDLVDVRFDIIKEVDIEKQIDIVPETTIQTTVVFGRTIDGIPVYGNGSKIAVRYNSMGELTMLTVDWKDLDGTYTGETFEKSVLDNMDTKFKTKVKDQNQNYIERKCGYFDNGYKTQSYDLVPLCSYLYEKVDGDITSRYIINIPIYENHSHIYYFE